MKYVIIGNSAAGIGTAEGIRQKDADGEILIISDEPYHTYSRPLISYLLLGKTTEQKMRYREDSFYEANTITLMADTKILSIDPNEKTILTHKNEKISYDKLMVATGSSAFVPPFEGLDTVSDKHTFMSLDDAKNLEPSLSTDKRVLIVGAGLIGLKCAEGIAGKVSKITVVDLADNILSSILDSDSALIVKKHIEEKGVQFQLSASVKSFSGNKAFLSSGVEIPFDVLVLAVGVRPNVSLIKAIGGEVGRGIVVSERLETSVPDIYAAGDCTESFDISSGQQRILALLPNAYTQGECAGINMAGGNSPYGKAIPMNAIGFFGLHIITAGTYKGDVYFEGTGDSYKKLFYSDNKLNGYILVGDVQKAGIYTSLIRERTPLDTLDFDLICKKPCLMAFTQSDRQEKLSRQGKEVC